MKSRIYLCITFGLCFVMTKTLASPTSDLQNLLGQFHAMRANFSQTLYMDPKTKPRKASGKMAVKRPQQFRWETTNPNHQILIANQDTLWIYDVDLEQAIKQKLNKQQSDSPAVFLSGDLSNLPQRYEIKEIIDKIKDAKTFELKAKSPEDMFQTIRLRFRSNKLRVMTVVTRIEQRSVFNFDQVKLNQPLSTKLFQFKPPRGVEVIINK